MKILGIIGVVIGLLALLMGLYLEFSVAPIARGEMGEYTLLIGGVAFLASIVPAIKKQNMAWLGVVFGLFALTIGAAYGTHMFS